MVQTVGYGSMGVHDPLVIERALETGYRIIDSARVYGNEEVCGKGIAGFLKKHPEVKREEIFYTTKVNEKTWGYEQTLKAVEESLERVKDIGYIDLILIHTPIGTPEQRLETYRALQDVHAQGKIKQIGVSNYGVPVLKELLAWDGLKVRPTFNQIELNPWLQHNDIVDFCAKEKITVEAYTPFIHGKKDDDSYLQSLSKKYNATVPQVLVRWNIQKNIIPIPKSANPERMRQNLEVGFFELTAEEVAKLGDPNAHVEIFGPDRTTYYLGWPKEN